MSQVGSGLPRLLAERYQLSDQLASGHLTSVWRGHDRVLGRDVVVKVLHPELATQPGVRARFRQEAVSAARLTHPNIVAVYDTGTQRGVTYLVMELVAGSTLRELLAARGALPAAEAAQIAFQVAQALDHAHRAGVVHRNLTPNNILLGPDGGVKVGDFAIAAAAEGDDPDRTDQLLSPPGYLAPEILQGRQPDGRADLYGLGGCLYEMLTGRPPPVQPARGASGAGQGSGPLVALRAARAGVPRELDHVVRRAMAASPADRYPTAEAMAAALAPWAATAEVNGGVGSDAPAALGLPLATAGQDQLGPGRGFLRQESRWLGWTLALVGMAAVVAVVSLALSRSVNLHLPGGTTRAPSTPPSSTAGAAATRLRFGGAFAYDPLGDGHENDQQARLAIDGDPTTAWTTQHYNRPALGGLKPGVGLVLDAGHSVAAHELDLTLTQTGGSLEVYGTTGDGYPPSFPDGWTRLAGVPEITSRRQRLTLQGQQSVRWLLVWFTSLPRAPDDPNRYQSGIAEALLGPSS